MQGTGRIRHKGGPCPGHLAAHVGKTLTFTEFKSNYIVFSSFGTQDGSRKKGQKVALNSLLTHTLRGGPKFLMQRLFP